MFNLWILMIIYTKAMAQMIEPNPIVITTAGAVRGKLVYNELLNLQYYAFHGIPYAENPTGDLRFKPPVPKKPWKGIYNATEEGPVCPQSERIYSKEMMNEDCLSININIPVQTLTKLPILVHIHDGQLDSVSGNEDKFGTQFFVKSHIIGITFNYRLGVLGFLSLDIEEASGNAAIKDIVLALKWIQNNIERFGGDPTQVTLSGDSAGSALVQYLLLTEKSIGLFQRTIQVSGSALAYRFFGRHPLKTALALTEKLGLKTEDTEKALKKLRAANISDIINAVKVMGNTDIRQGFRPYVPFLPCIEIEYEGAVLTKHPRIIIENGIPQNVPMLVGLTDKEGMKQIKTIQKNERLIEILNENFELCIPTDIEYPYRSNISIELAQKIRNFYFDERGINLENLESYISLISDTQFDYSILSFVKLHKQHSCSRPIYLFVFNFDGDLNWFKLNYDIHYPGACHTDSIGYTFLSNVTKNKIKNAHNDSIEMLEINLKLYTDFVRYGNPTPKGSTIIWPEFKNNDPSYMVLNSQPYVSHGIPAEKRHTFWSQIYDDYYQYVRDGGRLEQKPDP